MNNASAGNVAKVSAVHTIGSKDRYVAGLLATRGNCENRCGRQFMSYEQRVADVFYFYEGTAGSTYSITVCEHCAAKIGGAL